MRKHLLSYGIVVLALFAAILCVPPPSDVKAGGRLFGNHSSCNTNSCYTPTYYSQPEYIYVDRVIPVAYPVPFTVAVPVVSYLYNGGYGIPGYSPVYAAQPAAPTYGVQQPVMPQAQPTNGNGNGAPRTSALLQLSDAELDLLIGMIEKRLAARNGNGGAQTPTSPPPPVPQAPQSPKAYTDVDVTRVLSTKLGATQKSCMDCHTGASAKAGVKIFESPGVLSQTANWSKIWDAADAGRMPKEAQTNKAALLSDADCDVLRWKMTQSNGR
jgi:hypothetical protein